MFHRIRTILQPDRYHGHQAQPPFFEGWYYKVVDPAGDRSLAIIPAVFLGTDPFHRHALVQILDSSRSEVAYYRYPTSLFTAETERFEICIGPNRFSADRLELNLSGEAGTVAGALRFKGTRPWPITLRSPGIMGWYAWVPTMECYHGVVSLDHEVEGTLTLDREAVDFSGGRGYTEKDWGQAFPQCWIWLQTNHFSRLGVSLTASIARIPWRKTTFPGFIVGLWFEDVLYRFATYTGARVEHLAVTESEIEWVIHDKTYVLEIRATRAPGVMLYAPARTEMVPRVEETINASARVRLSTHVGDVLFEDTGRHAGLEVIGDIQQLQPL